MIIVADSGSSKTDWLLHAPGTEPLEFRTKGINPYFINEREIVKLIQAQCPDMLKAGYAAKEIYFFGEGCTSPDRREWVSNALTTLFPKAFVSVDSDLLGSAYATCGHDKGLCCVLGAGSNISFFDGEDIVDGKHEMGYILGDEGSGSWFGKHLVTDFLYGLMPTELSAAFADAYHLDKESVITNVYQKAGANAYLASFSEFLSTIRHSAYGQELINKGLREFIESHIMAIPEYHTYKCHFVGSVAYHFSHELIAQCNSHDIMVGKIIQRPIRDLLDFIHQRNLLTKDDF